VRRSGIVGHRYWIAVVFFLVTAAPGFWIPVLTNVLHAKGWPEIVRWAFIVPPLAGMLSPLVFAAKADRSYPAEKVLGFLMICGAFFLFAAFWFLEHGNSRTLFLVLLAINALITMPSWSLLNTIALTNVTDKEREFGLYRVWGTLGWIAAGLVVSLCKLDQSAVTGQLAGVIRIFAGLAALMLPHTPPKGTKGKGWRSGLGLDSFRILRDRNQGTYFLTAFLFTIPLTAFYMHTPRHLESRGVERVAAWMSTGPISEIIALMLLGVVLVRWRLKTLLLLAITCGIVRYGLFAMGGVMSSTTLLLAGVALHGICWTFFFESGRVFIDNRVEPGMRAQAQALLSLMSGGLGMVLGTLLVDQMYKRLVVAEGGPGWSAYWWILTGMCALAWLVFMIGYRGTAAPAKVAAEET
jgi:nucleoside transporter